MFLVAEREPPVLHGRGARRPIFSSKVAALPVRPVLARQPPPPQVSLVPVQLRQPPRVPVRLARI